MVHIFTSYWWLIFPIGWMIMGAIGSMNHYRHKSDMLKLLKSYADQGKDPPAALLDALKTDESRDYDHDDYYRGRRYRRYRGRGRGWWWQVVVFGAMAAGFGYAGYYGGGPQVFIALALAFGVASVALCVIGIIRALFAPKSADYREDTKD